MTSAGSVFAAESLDTVQNTSDVQAENVSDKDNSVTQDTEHKKKWFNFFGMLICLAAYTFQNAQYSKSSKNQETNSPIRFPWVICKIEL